MELKRKREKRESGKMEGEFERKREGKKEVRR